MKKFRPFVEIVASNDGKNWVSLNPDTRHEDYCITDIHLDTMVYKYLNVVQVLKSAKKKKRHK